MKRTLLLFLAAAPCFAHAVSMSTGELTVDGLKATYRLRMPAYELQHTPNPRESLPAAILLHGATRTASNCTADRVSMICELGWLFASEPGRIAVRVRLHEVTVPNHVHVLQARNGPLVDQVVFDAGQPEAALRFRQTGRVESALLTRPAAALAALLGGAAIGAAATWTLMASLIAGAALALLMPWPLTPAFLEAAIAIMSAYIGFETWKLPAAPHRWIAGLPLGFALKLYGDAFGVGMAVTSSAAVTGVALIVVASRLPSLRRYGSIVALAAGGVWAAAILLKP